MRRIGKWLLSFFVLVTIIVIFLPPIIGFGLQNYFFNKIRENNYYVIKVTQYKFGWFHSEMTLQVDLTAKDIDFIFHKLGQGTQTSPQQATLNILSHIDHGPIFYSFFPRFYDMFGLAAIKNQLLIPEKYHSIFATWGLNDDSFQNWEIFLNFFGKSSHYFNLSNLKFVYPQDEDFFVFRLESVEGKIWETAFTKKLKGKINFKNISGRNDINILIPSGTLDFSLRPDTQNLWIGEQQLIISRILLQDKQNNFIRISDVNLHNNTTSAQGFLNDEFQLLIEKITGNDFMVGPLQLNLSLHHLYEQAITQFIADYIKILQQGELYESQLRQKILFMIPQVVKPNSIIRINNLSLKTNRGNLLIRGVLTWPVVNTFAPNVMSDLLQGFDIKAMMNITSPLQNDLIKLITQLTYSNQIPITVRSSILQLRTSINFNLEMNGNMLLALVQSGVLEENEALALLTMMKNGININIYNGGVKELFLQKKINRELTYFLSWLYTPLYNQVFRINELIRNYQLKKEKELQQQLNTLVKNKFIIKNNNEYRIFITRENGVMRLNNKIFSTEMN